LGREDRIASDLVSGAVMGATIIISFLSLMSFADFLRVLWQQPPGAQQEEGEGQQQEEGRENDGVAGGENENDNNEVKIDNTATDRRIIELIEKKKKMTNATTKIDTTITIGDPPEAMEENNEMQPPLLDDRFGSFFSVVAELDILNSHREAVNLRNRATELRNLAMEREARRQNVNANQERPGNDGPDGDVVPVADDAVDFARPNFVVEDVENDNDSDGEDYMEEVDEEDVRNDLEAWMNNDDEDDNDEDDAMPPPFMMAPVGPDDGGVAFDPLDPVLQDDQVDMEINVALDELLGLRGPISTLVRNLLWLLAFNATYLGIFGFVPKTVGSVIYSSVFNTTLCGNTLKLIPYVSSEDTNATTVISLLSSLEEESDSRNTTFKLSDFAIVTLGYLSMACFIVISRYTIVALRRTEKVFGRNSTNHRQNLDDAQHLQRMQRIRNLARGFGDDMHDLDDEDTMGGLGDSVETVLDATVAIIKVCVLLFMKMFLLPLCLGLWLDASTARLFGSSVASRLAFAGGDLFSFLLLHWVAGISFMLLVTVFLLQLREVAHPEILARMIRPQEPQPDLLGNLMHETVLTHMKRMALSLAIYAPLLTMHVTIPAMLFHASGIDRTFTFFHLNFYHLLTPQLQIPLELITFHLSMLALLERHKNTIGGLQHYWLKFMCQKMGLTEYLLPQRIEAFELIGTKSVFMPQVDVEDLKVDPFFGELALKEEDIDQFVLSNIEKTKQSIGASSTNVSGEQLLNGQRVLSFTISSISLPEEMLGENGTLHLPTKIGRYRLEIEEDHTVETAQETKISFYREVVGVEVKRPPEGWDDLGVESAYEQGRWAWAKERKSMVEESLAERTPFRPSSKERRSVKLIAKVMVLVFLSWFAVIFTVVAILSCPLAVGRFFHHLLRVPPKYIHDPFAFCFGAGLFFPMASLLTRYINAVDQSLYQRCREWLGLFRPPPTGKMLVVLESLLLWIAIAPLALGLSYEFAVMKSPKWFSREEPFLDLKTLAISWIMGTVVLNTWSFLLYFKFFTRRFWSILGNGILEPPLNDDGNPNPNARNNAGEDANAERGLIWQGKRGRVSKFFKIMRSVLLDWEWDTVDRTIMIDDFARPTAKEIASALVGSALSYQIVLCVVLTIFKVQKGGFLLPILGLVDVGIFRKLLFQICMAIHVLVQIGSRSRASIDRWFEAAHEAARDDRYLIGELLMNYNPEEITN